MAAAVQKHGLGATVYKNKFNSYVVMQIIGRRPSRVFYARRPYALNALTTYSYSIHDYLLIIIIILNKGTRSRVFMTLENKKKTTPILLSCVRPCPKSMNPRQVATVPTSSGVATVWHCNNIAMPPRVRIEKLHFSGYRGGLYT